MPYVRIVGQACASEAEADNAAAAAAAAVATSTSATTTPGRTVVAAVSLRKGDLISSVPDAAVLTVDSSRAGAALKSASLGNGHGNAWREGVGLALALMSESAAGAASPWAPYVSWLAAAVPGLRATHPALWPVKERRALLAGTAAGARLGKRGEKKTTHAPAGLAAAGALARAFTSRHADLFAFARPALSFLEAYALVGAYAFSLGSDPPIAALVPTWDALDHDPGVWAGGPGVALHHDAHSGTLRMVSTRPVPPGAVVYNCYGEEVGPGECVRRYGWAPAPADAPGERLDFSPGEVGLAALGSASGDARRRHRVGHWKRATLAAAGAGGGRPLCVEGESGMPSIGLLEAAAAAAGALKRKSRTLYSAHRRQAAAVGVLGALAKARAAALRSGLETAQRVRSSPGRLALATAVRDAEGEAVRRMRRWVRKMMAGAGRC